MAARSARSALARMMLALVTGCGLQPFSTVPESGGKFFFPFLKKKKKKKRLCVYSLESRALAAQMQLCGAEAEGAGASNLQGGSPDLCGGAPCARPGRRGHDSEGSVCSRTPHRLMVRVNFVYKVPFVGEGGESPQL